MIELSRLIEAGQNALIATGIISHPVPAPTLAEILHSPSPQVQCTPVPRGLDCGDFRYENDPEAGQIPSRRDNIVIYANVPAGRRLSPSAWLDAMKNGLRNGEADLNQRGCTIVGVPTTHLTQRAETVSVPDRDFCIPELSH